MNPENKLVQTISVLQDLYQATTQTGDVLVLDIDASPVAVHAVVRCAAELKKTIENLEDIRG